VVRDAALLGASDAVVLQICMLVRRRTNFALVMTGARGGRLGPPMRAHPVAGTYRGRHVVVDLRTRAKGGRVEALGALGVRVAVAHTSPSDALPVDPAHRSEGRQAQRASA
jgi:hypothetical protein